MSVYTKVLVVYTLTTRGVWSHSSMMALQTLVPPPYVARLGPF